MLPEVAGRGLEYALGLLLLGLAARLAGRPDGDRRAFSVEIVTALVVTPVAWPHYFLFLLVPIALREPRLAPLWAVPWAYWLMIALPQGQAHVVFEGSHDLGAFGLVPSIPRLLLVLGLLATTLAVTAAGRPRRREQAADLADAVRLSAASA